MPGPSTEWAVLKTPLPEETCRVRGFHGHEGISELFRFELDLVADLGACGWPHSLGHRRRELR